MSDTDPRRGVSDEELRTVAKTVAKTGAKVGCGAIALLLVVALALIVWFVANFDGPPI